LAGLQGPVIIQRQTSGEQLYQPQPGFVQSSHRASDNEDDDILSVNVPPPDVATYAYYRDVPTCTAAAVNHVFATTSRRTEEDIETADQPYEAIYEHVDDLHASYLEPSSRRQTRRSVAW